MIVLWKMKIFNCFKRRDTLIGRYHKLLKQTIDIINREAIKIKIVSMINDIPHIFEQIKRVFIHVELCSEGEDAELIITDSLYLNLKKKQENCLYGIMMPKKVTMKGWEKITRNLFK